MSPPSLISRVRALCLALPEAVEVEAWGHPTFRVARKMFCTAAVDGSTISLKADRLERESLLAEGGRFYVPAYVGSKGWLGVRLDDLLLPDRPEAAGRAGDRAALTLSGKATSKLPQFGVVSPNRVT